MEREKKMIEELIKCPKCKETTMEKITNGKYIIDKCPKCGGVYLDKEEIEAMKNMNIWTYLKNYLKK